MSYSYEDIPDDSNIITTSSNDVGNRNKRSVRMLFWEQNLRKTHTQKTSLGEPTCTKCLMKHSPDYNSDYHYVGYIEIGYDLQSECIFKKCNRCNDTEILEQNVQDDTIGEDGDGDGGEDTEDIAPGGTEKVYPLFCMTLDGSGNNNRRIGAGRQLSHLDSNKGMDSGTINEITAAFNSEPTSGGPTFNQRLNWGRKRYDYM